jgi:hypothetical protein
MQTWSSGIYLLNRFSLGKTYNCGLPYCEFCITQVRTLLTPKTRYPVLYCVLILPLSIVCWETFYKEATTSTYQALPVATFIMGIMFTFSGILNQCSSLLVCAYCGNFSCPHQASWWRHTKDGLLVGEVVQSQYLACWRMEGKMPSSDWSS